MVECPICEGKIERGICQDCGWITNRCPECQERNIMLRCGCGTSDLVKRAGVVGPLLGGLGGLAIGSLMGHPWLGMGAGAGAGYLGEKLLTQSQRFELIRLADILDKKGLLKEANIIDTLLKGAQMKKSTVHPFGPQCSRVAAGRCPSCGQQTGDIDRMSILGELVKHAELLRQDPFAEIFGAAKSKAEQGIQEGVASTVSQLPPQPQQAPKQEVSGDSDEKNFS